MITRPLGDFAKIQQGRYLSKDAMAPSCSPSTPIPVHGANGIIGWTDKAMYEDGVPLVTCRGSNCGMVLWAEGPLWVSNNAMAILPHSGLRRFTYYRLLSSPPYDVVSGSAQPQITRSALAPRVYDLPPEDAHAGIEAILAALDDKKELNRQMNETLEAQARALFRDWFVDFGPVKAKMAGVAPYLAPDLWTLFPDHLDDDGVPEGWKWIPASKLFEIRIGRTPPRKETENFVDGAEGVPWLSIKTMGSGDAYIFDTEESLTPESVERFKVPLVRKGIVLLSFKLTVGRVAIAGCDMTTNEAIAHFNEMPTSPPSAFTYSFLKQFDYQRLGSTSSIATAVNSQTIKAIEFPCPGEGLLRAFDELAAPLLKKIESNTSESRTLVQIRDLLLPKLMSGEIRVGDVERELESA